MVSLSKKERYLVLHSNSLLKFTDDCSEQSRFFLTFVNMPFLSIGDSSMIILAIIVNVLKNVNV